MRVNYLNIKHLIINSMKFDISKIQFDKNDLAMGLKLPKKLTIELAEETGLHIGDGSMNFYSKRSILKGLYQLRGHINDDKQHYQTRIKELYKTLYNLELNLRNMPSTGVYGFQIWSDALVNFKSNILNLSLGKKYNVSIPLIFLKNKELKQAVIRGIFDTDGCVYLENKNKKLYPRIIITTISSKLSNQLLNILKELGFKTTKYSEPINHAQKRKNISYIISIRGVEMFHKFIREIKPKNPKHIEKYNFFLDNKNFPIIYQRVLSSP